MSKIYGEKYQFWMDKMKEGLDKVNIFNHDRVLCSNQISSHSAGFRDAALVETIFGYSVRLRSGLCDNQVMFGGRRMGRYVSYEEALQWGKEWVDESPDFRVLVYDEKCNGCGLDYHQKVEVK